MNKAMIIGNLGNDPEVHSTQNGKVVSSFSVATTHKWTDKDGNKQQDTEWHRVVAWGKLAEICGEYLKKGSKVYIEGRLHTRKWQDKDGIDRQTTEIVAGEMEILSSASE